MYIQMVALYVFTQLLLAYRFTHRLVGVHIHVYVVVVAEDTSCAGIVAGTVFCLLKTAHLPIRITGAYLHFAGMITSGNGLERVACNAVIEHPEIAPDGYIEG